MSLIEQIKAVLEQQGIAEYRIIESVQESLESFYVRKKLDLRRRTDVTDYVVSVFCSHEEAGKQMLGSSMVHIHPEMETEEIREALQKAYHAAALVCNEYYELNAGKREEFVPSTSRFAGQSLEESTRQIVEALYEADTSEKVFINSAEVFVKHIVRRIVNSRDVDVSYETYLVSGEYVVQCIKPRDVETFHQFSYHDASPDALRRDVEEAFAMTQARAEANTLPSAGKYTILLSGENLQQLLQYYCGRSNAGVVYQKYSNYQIGDHVQGDAVQGDALTIYMKAKEPYSDEGIPMKDRLLMENGTLKMLHGGCRTSYYLGIEPTGDYTSISVPVGSRTMEELKSSPYLHIVSFSDFQMDILSGHFGGEIRLAFLYDGENVTPVTGGSINGSILEVQGNMVFSRERYQNDAYEGPYAVRMESVRVAGTDDTD
ncbi:MAG: hypothetical protein K1W30_12935 [Lachnospiraceae bacterium]